MALGERIVEVLKQGRNSPVSVGCQVAIIYAVTKGWLDGIAIADVHNFEQKLFEKLQNQKSDLLKRFEEGYFEDEDIASLEDTLREMTR